jgi:hypothetical protein
VKEECLWNSSDLSDFPTVFIKCCYPSMANDLSENAGKQAVRLNVLNELFYCHVDIKFFQSAPYRCCMTANKIEVFLGQKLIYFLRIPTNREN